MNGLYVVECKKTVHAQMTVHKKTVQAQMNANAHEDLTHSITHVNIYKDIQIRAPTKIHAQVDKKYVSWKTHIYTQICFLLCTVK